jgi:DNA polymerase eta
MVRLAVPDDQPLAVQQWQGLIAINYPARAFGLGRHVTATEAKKICPNIILQHVATWKVGETEWAYRENADLSDHKVSLDPYRMESKKIFSVIKEALPPPPLQKIEKAGIDELFLDLSAQTHAILLERYPELNGPPPYDDPTEDLPRPPTTVLNWQTDCLIDLDESETEEDDPDWDDVVMMIGSEIMRDLRARIREELRYTTSGGIARNKMLAKLGSDYKKPNAQTVVRNRAVQHFMSGFKFTKIRNLGGKLGDEVVAMFNTDTVQELLEVPLLQLQRLGDETGSWLYNTIRGEDNSEVNSRTQIKSMLSAKSFRPPVNTFEQATKWLRIFAADIFSRSLEEGVLENKRRPKTITLHHRQGGQTRSKQSTIPQGKPLSEEVLFGLAKDLLAHVVAGGRVWPCANLSLSVGGFEDGVGNNKGLSNFLVRGDEAKALISKDRERSDSLLAKTSSDEPTSKRRKIDVPNIQKFFPRRGYSKDTPTSDEGPDAYNDGQEHSDSQESDDLPSHDPVQLEGFAPDGQPPSGQGGSIPFHQTKMETYFCSRCQKGVPVEDQSEHSDWHFAKDLAKDLQEQERNQLPGSRPTSTAPSKPPTKARGRPSASTSARKPEKGQQQLAFGRG